MYKAEQQYLQVGPIYRWQWITQGRGPFESFQDVLHVDVYGVISSYKRWHLYRTMECVKSHLLLIVVVNFLKEGRKERKLYRTLFTCMFRRVIHIEPPIFLSTECFLMRLRRFNGQRGNVRLFRSDSGTTFVGASVELT